MILMLAACVDPKPADPDPRGPAPDPADATGVIVLAGGGSEAESGDAAGWSARLYGRLLDGGDVTGDGLVTVIVLSTEEETTWLPEYFVWLGADEARNLRVASRADADRGETAAELDLADAVFVKGGDQGLYYDLWDDSGVEDGLVALRARGGGVGGTSAGAMSMAGWALAGGMDLISRDVLEDAHTPFLDDASDGGSGIHGDFLGFVPDAVIDTHVTERARIGRLAGTMAKVIEDEALPSVLGIGLEQRTGLVVRDGVAEVVGVGAVVFLRPTGGGHLVRAPGRPLVFTDLVLDRLTDGWAFDLARSEVVPGPDAQPVTVDAPSAPPAGWAVYGDLVEDAERFETVAARDPEPYALRDGSKPPLLEGAVGFTDAHYEDWRAVVEETAFRALYDRGGHTAVMIGYGGSCSAEDGVIACEDNPYVDDEPSLSALFVATRSAEWRGLSPEPSTYDVGAGSLRAAAISGARLSILGESARNGLYWNGAEATVEAR
jgi:cyanophycinase